MAAPASDSQPSLSNLRTQIDAVDAELVRLISARGALAAEIGRLKAQDGSPIYAPDREQEILAKLAAANPGPFPTSVLQAIYRELMSGSFMLERPLRIAFLGPRGSFSHLAASAKFGASVEYEPVDSIRAAFREVERKHADFAVVPIENSITGGIVDTLDAFQDANVRICAELYQPIRHNLLSRGPLNAIARVYSKPEIFAQCRDWLAQTGLATKTIPVASSSKAAEMASTEDGAAALGSTLAAEIYGLPIQVANIEDDPNNTTRFFILGQDSAKRTGDDRTAILFGTADRAGALVEVLDAFRVATVNLSMITSRPSRRERWEYCFFVDCGGHETDSALQAALAAARPHCTRLTVLGSFPRATPTA